MDYIFYCPNIESEKTFSEQESIHCAKVLRMKNGDKLTVTDGKGFFYECTLVNAHPKHCEVDINAKIAHHRAWSFYLQLAFAPTKQMNRNEWLLEKATEIGVNRITPLYSQFSERKEIKNERMEKITVSAIKQSKQAHLPTLDEMTTFDSIISQPFDGQKFIAHCHNGSKNNLSNSYHKGKNALILIGPEGDFSNEEVEKAISHGYIPITLGNNRLRTETAALTALLSIHILT